MRYATQDPKYAIQDGRLVNAASGQPIPADEPVFIFRAKDTRALEALQAYVNACDNPEHVQAVEQRIIDFERFAETHASLMREPDTAPGVKATRRSVEVRGGESDYYCIELQDGRSIDGLSGAHLVDIDSFAD